MAQKVGNRHGEATAEAVALSLIRNRACLFLLTDTSTHGFSVGSLYLAPGMDDAIRTILRETGEESWPVPYLTLRQVRVESQCVDCPHNGSPCKVCGRQAEIVRGVD